MAQSFYPTAQNIIDAALRALAVIDPESSTTPTTTERTNALTALNYLVTSWQAEGMQVWCQKQYTHILTADTVSYTIGSSGADITASRPMGVTQAWLRSNDTKPIDIPINIIDRTTYNNLSVKTSTGNTNQLYYDPQYDRDSSNNGTNAKGKVYLWPVPDTTGVATYDLYFSGTRPIEDFNAITDTLDFPQEWFNAIKWNLAYQLSFDYGTPIEKQNKLEKLADEEKSRVLAWDVEQNSVFFQPDRRFTT